MTTVDQLRDMVRRFNQLRTDTGLSPIQMIQSLEPAGIQLVAMNEDGRLVSIHEQIALTRKETALILHNGINLLWALSMNKELAATEQ